MEEFGFKNCFPVSSYSHNIFLWTKYKDYPSQDILSFSSDSHKYSNIK